MCGGKIGQPLHTGWLKKCPYAVPCYISDKRRTQWVFFVAVGAVEKLLSLQNLVTFLDLSAELFWVKRGGLRGALRLHRKMTYVITTFLSCYKRWPVNAIEESQNKWGRPREGKTACTWHTHSKAGLFANMSRKFKNYTKIHYLHQMTTTSSNLIFCLLHDIFLQYLSTKFPSMT
jgi:hypothetical protein